mmetsp:Transcript_47289/g.145665  ORF Transcript_47289/g.145665 Transcript_47289/m.145665 type:complete len:228 (+) Transcript_47289:45-728(+)|eukprot:CAMPEP_0204593278 /NCGR_PEP_ID=MMETSP0661-20131031/51412_1 /ASSEMBLY_ACC=CAM_ASM_000606 /TAXON_ID=109239 /ORGANISM="Alexandrium margalefi, Strain AMGDE01CS-322" /LENGTH=227 /DNA_ID=CAMNT_0051603573 /DNA_START=42 /DNA_END=725 /DNA_ORIENTATION=-
MAGGVIQVEVCMLTGTQHSIEVPEDLSVKELKFRLQVAIGIKHDVQVLVCGCQRLRGSQLLFGIGQARPGVLELTLIRKSPDHAAWLQRVSVDGMQLAAAPEELRADEEIVMAAVQSSGLAFQFAAETMRADADTVVSVVQKNAGAFAFASHDLRSSRDFVLGIVRLQGCALAFASDELRSDRQVVLEACLENEYALLHAARHLRRDPVFRQQLTSRGVDTGHLRFD